jgi:hypothetical protein
MFSSGLKFKCDKANVRILPQNQLADIATKPQPTVLFVALVVAQREAILQWEAEYKLTKDLQPVALTTFQLHGCNIPRSRRTVRFEQLPTLGQPALRMGLVTMIGLKNWPASCSDAVGAYPPSRPPSYDKNYPAASGPMRILAQSVPEGPSGL